MDKKKYEYNPPEEMSFTDYLKTEVPDLVKLSPEQLENVVQIYAQSYYVNGNWET